MEVLRRRYATDTVVHDRSHDTGFSGQSSQNDPTIRRSDLCRKDVKVRAAARNLCYDRHAPAPLAPLASSDLKHEFGRYNNMNRNNSNDRTTAGVIAATMLIASVALLALVGLTGSICAAGGENARGSEGEIAGAAVSAASVTDSINYQGRLTDRSGSPLTGTYGITFRLYDVSTGGTALDKDAHNVDVADGLFNTGIDFDQSCFDGSELWLGVAVGTDSEMTPRQELRPVPYALSLVPGAEIISSRYPALHVESTHTYGIGVYGKGGEYGGYFTTNQGGTSGFPPVHNAAVNAATTYDYSDGVYAHTSGDKSHGVYAETTGDYSFGVRVETTGDNGGGVYAETTGDDSWGVRAYTKGDKSHGVYAKTTGDRSSGVRAYTKGDDSDGVYAKTTGDDSRAVYACSDNGIGVSGKGKYGGYFTTNQGGTSGDHNAGVNVTTTYRKSDGVRAYTSGQSSHGVCVDTSGGGSDGVRVETTGDYSFGVRVETTGDDSHGVLAVTSGENSDGVHGYSEKRFGVYGVSDSLDYAGVYAKGRGDGADLILGGSDGKIQSDPTDSHSNIYLSTNGDIRINLDNDGNGEDADFEICDKDDDCIFQVDESGDVSYGGPNIAAFPRPAYDSGWVSISKNTIKTLTHNLGGNPDNYVVDLQFKSGSLGRNQVGYGGYSRSAILHYGANWRELDSTQIKVRRKQSDTTAEQIRVRIWVYK